MNLIPTIFVLVALMLAGRDRIQYRETMRAIDIEQRKAAEVMKRVEQLLKEKEKR